MRRYLEKKEEEWKKERAEFMGKTENLEKIMEGKVKRERKNNVIIRGMRMKRIPSSYINIKKKDERMSGYWLGNWAYNSGGEDKVDIRNRK